ncbi:MAG TPA: hypothetical protein VF475_16040 [Sphingobium sp.]
METAGEEVEIAPCRAVEADIVRMEAARFVAKPRQQFLLVRILDQRDALAAEDDRTGKAAAFRGLPFQCSLTVFLLTHRHARIPRSSLIRRLAPLL